MLPDLQTTRLRLRPRTLADIDDNLAMDRDSEVHKFIYIKKLPDWDAHRRDLIEKTESGWPPTGGLWVVEWRETPGFLGWCGLFPLQDSGFIEIAYRYNSAAWGKGVATEAAERILEYGFRDLALDPIVAVTAPGNGASQAVLKKIGLQPKGIEHHYDMDLPFFHLARSDYLNNAPGE